MPTQNAIVDRAIAAHGGEAKWKELSTLRATWTFRGLMFKLRLREASLRRLSATISTRQSRVEVEPFPRPASRGVFDAGSVEVTSPGSALQRRDDGRASFRSLKSLFWWDDLELLYFSGYVLWNYAQLPFLLLQPGLRFTDAGTTRKGNETWDKVVVDFPESVPTHSPRQTFYFGPDGLLRRHDYWVGIMSRLARGARYIHSYQQVDGFTLPSRIEMKLGTWGESFLPFISLGFVDFDDVQVK